MPTMSDPNDPYTSKIYLGDSHDKPLSVQGGPCPTGECHRYSSHCGRCGGCSGYQGHHFAYCKVTRTDREFHFCCPDDCELGGHDADSAVL